MPEPETVVTLLRNERPARNDDLVWLIVPDMSQHPSLETVGELLERLTSVTTAAGQRE